MQDRILPPRNDVADAAPTLDNLTGYDEQHCTIYLQLLEQRQKIGVLCEFVALGRAPLFAVSWAVSWAFLNAEHPACKDG